MMFKINQPSNATLLMFGLKAMKKDEFMYLKFRSKKEKESIARYAYSL